MNNNPGLKLMSKLTRPVIENNDLNNLKLSSFQIKITAKTSGYLADYAIDNIKIEDYYDAGQVESFCLYITTEMFG